MPSADIKPEEQSKQEPLKQQSFAPVMVTLAKRKAAHLRQREGLNRVRACAGRRQHRLCGVAHIALAGTVMAE